MDALAPALSLLGDDSLAVGLLVLSGFGLAILVARGLLQGRSEVRRRAAAGAEPGGAKQSPGKGGKVRPLDRLGTYIETTFSGNDDKQSRLLRQQLIQAGYFDQRAVSYYFAARVGLGVAFGLAAYLALPLFGFAGMKQALWTSGLALTGYLLPSFYLKRRIGQRATAHRLGFPDFMDLMVVCAEAGLSMEAAIDRIARELVEGHPALAENLYMTSLEIRAGRSFTEALERMGERLGIEEATMLATLLQQSAELGTSLSQSLRVYSDEMRNKRMSRAEEKAYALPAKLVVPLTLFVFPVLIVTLMLPVVIRMSGMFGG
jgi:tight adherence protein C